MTSSTKPYLLRAFYDWITDNEFTPYVVIDAKMPGVIVPRAYIEEDRIVLDISPQATQNLSLLNELIEFDASFSGVFMRVSARIHAVLAIYAKENGMGMVFGEDEEESDGDDNTPPPKATLLKGIKNIKRGKPHLKVVK